MSRRGVILQITIRRLQHSIGKYLGPQMKGSSVGFKVL